MISLTTTIYARVSILDLMAVRIVTLTSGIVIIACLAVFELPGVRG